MPTSNVRTLNETAFSIRRLTDKEAVSRLNRLVKDGNYSLQKSSFSFTFGEQAAEYPDGQLDKAMEELLGMETISARQIAYYVGDWLRISVDRGWNQQSKRLHGTQDSLVISPVGQNHPELNVESLVKAIALARKHFDAVDGKPFMELLDEGPRSLYESREQDLQRLERMQEGFFNDMREFTLGQQKQQQEFQRDLEYQHAERQKSLEQQHADRLKQLEAQEAELHRVRAEIDERDNRQTRRDIYDDIKKKLDERNKSFELTAGTKKRRWFTFVFTLLFLSLFAWGFYYCFERNVVNGAAAINWIALGSQVGFAIAFIGMATFLLRWTNQWSQKHAEEEFKLKRLDLDIDRAQWLVELAMEWKNITKSEISTELIDRLSRSLFVVEESRDVDIHPAETLLSAIFGKAGSLNIEFPTKLTMQRSESNDGKTKDEKSSK
jgi:hypothetical protein